MKVDKLIIELYDDSGETLAEVRTKIYCNPINDPEGNHSGEYFYSCPLLDDQFNSQEQLIKELTIKLRLINIGKITNCRAEITYSEPIQYHTIDITI